MNYRIAVNETLRATRFIEIKYNGDIDKLVSETEENTQDCGDVGFELEERGAEIISDNDVSISDIYEWETDSLNYSVMEEEAQ
ncbi:hypothetical protein ACSFB8_04390 [Enterococcus faecalis]